MELLIKPNISWSEKIKDFLRECINPNTIICDEKLFEWFFIINQKNPTQKNKELRFLIAQENDKLHALLGFYECDFLVKGVIKKGAWGCGWFTARTNQNMFLGGLLRQAYLNEFEVAGNIGCSETTISIASKMGSKIIDKINPIVLNKESLEIAKKSISNFKYKNNNFDFEIYSQKASESEYIRHSEFDKKRNNSIKTLLSQEYFSWRYGVHPYFEYMITKIKFHNSKFDSGAFIWRLVNLSNGKKLCRIVDFDISNIHHYEFIVVNLIRKLIYELQQHSCDYADCFTTDLELINLLKKLGWIHDKENKYPSLIDPVKKGSFLNAEFYIREETNFQNLDLQLYRGDGDADRPNRKIFLSK